jgi:hypothetical protein
LLLYESCAVGVGNWEERLVKIKTRLLLGCGAQVVGIRHEHGVAGDGHAVGGADGDVARIRILGGEAVRLADHQTGGLAGDEGLR